MQRRIKACFCGAAVLGLMCGTTFAGGTITGAGATFPYPIYAKWAYAYNRLTGVKLNYQSIGSGGGIKQIKAKTVDFGASDAPLKPEELTKWGLVQWPMIIGGVCPVVNIKGITANRLKMTPDILADVFLGRIVKWNDPRIRAANPGVPLPSRGITVVHRADGSGTTWIFTNYLSKISSVWKSRVGNGKAVSWPVGVGGKGNEGVAAFVRKVRGAIGYVEYAYALQSRMATVQLRNRVGTYVAPTSAAFQAAAAAADWEHAAGYYMVLTDQPGDKSWPITGASFILMYKKQVKPTVAETVLKFWDWSYRSGGRMALDLDYVPMPGKVVEIVERMWAREIRGADGAAIWPAR
ncbi:MAG: phosphate ABC transporter substrate-binding protein PstS [Kiritimatiellaeota bacterium]|nr:phosphate ABC transporter substrate-binding protein PstS [Kiritimatiellota bacterium]